MRYMERYKCMNCGAILDPGERCDCIERAEEEERIRIEAEKKRIPWMCGISEAAKRTGLSYDFIRRACMRGDVVHVKAGSRYFVNMEKLAEYLNGGTV